MKRILTVAVGVCVMWTAAPLYASQLPPKDILRTDDGSVVEGTALATKADLEDVETALREDIKATSADLEATETALRADLKAAEASLRNEMRWMVGIMIALFAALLAGVWFLFRVLLELKGQLAAVVERLQIIAPTINPAQDGQGRFDLAPAANKTEAG